MLSFRAAQADPAGFHLYADAPSSHPPFPNAARCYKDGFRTTTRLWRRDQSLKSSRRRLAGPCSTCDSNLDLALRGALTGLRSDEACDG